MKIQTLKQLYQTLADRQTQVYSQINHLNYHHTVNKDQANGSIQFSLAISNHYNSQIKFNQAYPNIEVKLNIPIIYFIPQNASIYSSSQINFAANYGGKMQFPFISLKQKTGNFGLLFAFIDEQGNFKEIRFKMTSELLKLSVIYYDLSLQTESKLDLPTFLMIPFITSENFVHQSLQIYKSISKNILLSQPFQENNKFNQNFVLRVIELFEIQWNDKHKRVAKYNSENSLVQMIDQDEKLIGPIKFIHLRDWSSNGDGLKTKFGNYLKNSLTGPKINVKWLQHQIRYLQNIRNIGVGLYVEGYLVSKLLFDQFKQTQFEQMQMKDANGNPYTIWGSSSFVMCSSHNKWRQLLASSLAKVHQNLQNEGFYIDEFGFGSKTSPYKICTNNLHAHTKFDLQVGQRQTLRQIHEKIGKYNVKIYTQQTPNDVTMKQLNGSLSSAAKNASKRQTQIPLLISRFINPSFKIYQLITEYTMGKQDILSNDKIIEQNIELITKGLIVSFWNGNGIYVPKNLNFYDESILKIIRKLNQQFLYFQDYFIGLNPIPLVDYNEEKGINQILKNQFTNRIGKSIYILLNWSSCDCKEVFNEIQINLPLFSLGILHQKQYQILVKI